MSNLEPKTDLDSKKKPPLILAVDTTSSRASLALGQGTELLGIVGLVTTEKRSTNLITEVDWLLTRLGCRIEEIDAFSAIVGPGGFTGVRVGLATIKGFAHALQRPVVGLTSLAVTARAGGASACSCVLIDAHRGEVFAQLFSIDEAGQLTKLSEAVLAKLTEILDEVAQFQQQQGLASILFCGDGALLHMDAIAAQAANNSQAFQAAKFLTAKQVGWIVQAPLGFLAAEAVHYAQEKFLLGEVMSADQVAAYYIRPAEAEVKLRLGLIGKKRDSCEKASH